MSPTCDQPLLSESEATTNDQQDIFIISQILCFTLLKFNLILFTTVVSQLLYQDTYFDS